jgi:hypothetical protein
MPMSMFTQTVFQTSEWPTAYRDGGFTSSEKRIALHHRSVASMGTDGYLLHGHRL